MDAYRKQEVTFPLFVVRPFCIERCGENEKNGIESKTARFGE